MGLERGLRLESVSFWLFVSIWKATQCGTWQDECPDTVEYEDKGASMLRKLFMVAAAAVVPMSGLVAAGVAGGGIAGAMTPPVLGNVTCTLGGSVNFENNPPVTGISPLGTITPNKDGTTTAITTPSGCTGGTVFTDGGVVIATKNTKCAKPFTTPAGCSKGLYVGGAEPWLASPATVKSIGKAIKRLPLSLTQGGFSGSLQAKAHSVTTYIDPPTGPCANEDGWTITGSFKTHPATTGATAITLTICLGGDSDVTGPSISVNNFVSDLTAGDTVGIADIDPGSSSLAIG